MYVADITRTTQSMFLFLLHSLFLTAIFQFHNIERVFLIVVHGVYPASPIYLIPFITLHPAHQ
jgi:hypothetical protein